MAVVHSATLRPTKPEFLAAWLPDRDWFTGPTGDVTQVAAYRFDDPADAVGIETLLVRVGGGPVYQVPLTYRDAPLPGGDDWLVVTAEHSVLGKRWIYDAAGDPLYAATLASAILGNTGQAEQLVDREGRLEPRDFSMSIASNAPEGAKVPTLGAIQDVVAGNTIRIVTDTVELTVLRRIGAHVALPGTVLTGIWPGQTTPAPLAAATLH